jgi:Na+/melibiose symporter-like transporter
MILIAALISAIVMFIRKGSHRIGWCLITFWISWFGYVEYCEFMDGRWLLTAVFMIASAIAIVNTISAEVKKHEPAIQPIDDTVEQAEEAAFVVIEREEH